MGRFLLTLYYQYDNIINMIELKTQEVKTLNTLFEVLSLLIPVLLIDIALAAAAVRHILRHPHYHFGNRAMWIMIAVILLLFGPIIYFIFGKGENE